MDFVITGLPRSRTAWTAAYLTHGETFCIHEGLKLCANGVGALRKAFPRHAIYRGISDPAAALAQDKFIAEFPLAKWIIIERPYKDVEMALKRANAPSDGLHIIQAKLEELRAKVDPLVIPFQDLNQCIENMARHINPAWDHSKERRDMMLSLNIQSDLARAKTEIESGPDLRHLLEPVRLTPTCNEYLTTLKAMCGENELAYRWLEQVINAALVWDHFVDGDAMNPALFEGTMQALVTEWPLNEFLRKNAYHLMPAVVAAIAAWRASYQEGASKDLAYEVYRTIPAAVAFVLGGNPLVAEYMPKIAELVLKLRREDDRRDGGKR